MRLGKKRRANSHALPFVVLPLAVMIVAMLLSVSAAVSATKGTPATDFQGSATFCANPSQRNCIPQGAVGTAYYCDPGLGGFLPGLQACNILPSCGAPPYPPPAWCVSNVLTAAIAGCLVQFIASGSAGCPVFLPAGFSVFIPTQQIASSITTGGAFFGFVGGGASGYISMVGVAVGIISLAGLTVFGSGEQGEGLHILFQGGMVLGLWLIISGLEGFPGGNDAVFASLNSAVAGAGTFIWSMLTLSEVIGFLGLVSRGA
jgi:hypothetical protein